MHAQTHALAATPTHAGLMSAGALRSREALLLAAAEAIAEGQTREAQALIDELLEGLELPADLTWHIFGTALAQRIGHRAATDNLYLQNLEVSQISLFNVLARHLPLVSMAGRIANELLAGYMAHREQVTLLDLGIGTAQQEVALIETLAARGALPRRLHVIAVEPGRASLDEAGRHLHAAAQRLGLELEFTGIAAVAESLGDADWATIAAHSGYLLVNAAFAAHHIQSTGAGPAAARDEVFRRIRALKPIATVLLEPDSDHLNADFSARFAACWRHFGAIFGLVDGLPIEPADRSAVKLFFAREIEDILANAEDARTERHETTTAWAQRLSSTGYRPFSRLPFDLPASVNTVTLVQGASQVQLVVKGVSLASVICARGDEPAEWVDTRRAGECVIAGLAQPEPAAEPTPLRVADVMRREVSSIRIGTTLREAARALNRSGASDLVVQHEDGGFAGILSEGDLIRAMMPRPRDASGLQPSERLMLNGRSLSAQAIDDLVITNPLVLSPDDDLLRVADIMVTRQVRRIPVVAGGRAVGSISRAELCSALFGCAA